MNIKSLHALEIRVLVGTDPGTILTCSDLQKKLDLKPGQCNQALSWLAAKGLIAEFDRTTEITYDLTDLGADYARHGAPAERILSLLKQDGPMSLPEISKKLKLENRDVGSAFGSLSKEGALRMDEEKRITLVTEESQQTAALASLIQRADSGSIAAIDLSPEQADVIARHAKKRGGGAPFHILEVETIRYQTTKLGESARAELFAAGSTGEEAGRLTPEMLETGAWHNYRFRSYNVEVPPSRLPVGRRNPYGEYLDDVKDTLVSLGFEEFDGPLVETEFWNGDALFMPQFHSARDIHDVYYVRDPPYAREIEEPWLERVASAHEDGWETGSKGWGYQFDRTFTRRLVLRSQGTVLSAKQLRTARVPGKYFGIARCFRYDQVDATHGADFYQAEGIVLGQDVNLRTLLGLLKMFAVEVAGATDVRYVPAYFPFTEPSIEVHIKHPVLGWFELGGSGVFRPEVTEPLGVHVPVLAWGLGIDRMALMQLGLDDLRELFASDLDKARMRRRSS